MFISIMDANYPMWITTQKGIFRLNFFISFRQLATAEWTWNLYFTWQINGNTVSHFFCWKKETLFPLIMYRHNTRKLSNCGIILKLCVFSTIRDVVRWSIVNIFSGILDNIIIYLHKKVVLLLQYMSIKKVCFVVL